MQDCLDPLPKQMGEGSAPIDPSNPPLRAPSSRAKKVTGSKPWGD